MIKKTIPKQIWINLLISERFILQSQRATIKMKLPQGLARTIAERLLHARAMHDFQEWAQRCRWCLARKRGRLQEWIKRSMKFLSKSKKSSSISIETSKMSELSKMQRLKESKFSHKWEKQLISYSKPMTSGIENTTRWRLISRRSEKNTETEWNQLEM